MNKIYFLLSFCVSIVLAQNPKIYEIYTSDGKKVSLQEIIEESKDADAVFFGEIHNNVIAHWLQLEFTKTLYEQKKENLILGAEMFESDNQIIIDEYLKGYISTRKFQKEARLWVNYQRDYKPLLEFAKANQLKFIATNIPNRYASSVYRKGISILDSLSTQAKKYMAPLPLEVDMSLKSYREMAEAMPTLHGTDNNMVKAQAIKDATMAYFIFKNLKDNKCFLHYNGQYHTLYKEGIVYYLQKYSKKKNLKTVTIHIEETQKVTEFPKDYDDKTADFIILTKQNFPKSH